MIGKMPQTRWRCDRRCALRLGAEKRLTRRCMGGGDRCGERNPFGRDGKAANRRKAAALETRRARFGREKAMRLHIFFGRTAKSRANGLAQQKKTGLKRISPVFAHCDCQKLSMTMLPVASTMPAICTGVSFSWKRKQE